jgi:hypothetical protein
MSLYSRGSEMLNRSLLAIRVDCLLLQKKKRKEKKKTFLILIFRLQND